MRTAALPSSFQLATVRGSRAPRTTSTPPLSPSCATMAPPYNPLAPSTRTRGRSDPLSRSPMMISSSLEKQRSVCWRNSLPRTTGMEREIRLQARAAVGRDLGAVDVASRVRDQKGDKFRDFVCFADATQRDVLGEVGVGLFRVSRDHRCVDKSWVDCVDADPEAPKFEGGVPGHSAYGPFAGGVRELARYGAHRRDRRDVDD